MLAFIPKKELFWESWEKTCLSMLWKKKKKSVWVLNGCNWKFQGIKEQSLWPSWGGRTWDEAQLWMWKSFGPGGRRVSGCCCRINAHHSNLDLQSWEQTRTGKRTLCGMDVMWMDPCHLLLGCELWGETPSPQGFLLLCAAVQGCRKNLPRIQGKSGSPVVLNN